MTSPNEATARLREVRAFVSLMWANTPLIVRRNCADEYAKAIKTFDDLTALLDQRAGDVPEGYRLVPVERLVAFRNVMCGDWCNPGAHIPECTEASAMLAAAPTPTASSPIGNGGAEDAVATIEIENGPLDWTIKNAREWIKEGTVAHLNGELGRTGWAIRLQELVDAVTALRTPAASSADAGLIERLWKLAASVAEGSSLDRFEAARLLDHRAQEPQS